jgi:transcriptional regulator with XRE-family HTH domain
MGKHEIKSSDHIPGDRVTITRLMLKLQQTRQPNYIIGAACGIHPTTLSLYARGKQPISAKHLIALCELFQCEADNLIGDVVVEIGT